MIASERDKKIIQNEMDKIKDHISLKIFTDFKIKDDGSKNRRCMTCESTINLLNFLETSSKGKLTIEEISTIEDEELAEKYGIEKIPTILFLDDEGNELIRYIAEPKGGLLGPFLKTLQIYSGNHSYYRDAIQGNLKNIDDSNVKVFITQTCPYCPQILPTVTEFALESKGKIKTKIIDINANPEVATKYQIQGVPHTLVNEKEHIYGMFTPQDLLDKLTKGKRDFGGMYA
jgi:glutaredoxin-like protein